MEFGVFASVILVEEDINFILVDNNVTKIWNSRTKVLVVMELLVVMVAVEMMIFSLDFSSKLVVLDTIADNKLCQIFKEINKFLNCIWTGKYLSEYIFVLYYNE